MSGYLFDDDSISTKEQFTLKTLAEFYTDAAKAGGMEVLHEQYDKWVDAMGPNLGSVVANYRLRPVQPKVQYLIKFSSGNTHNISFDNQEQANSYLNRHFNKPGSTIIKLVEELL